MGTKVGQYVRDGSGARHEMLFRCRMCIGLARRCVHFSDRRQRRLGKKRGCFLCNSVSRICQWGTTENHYCDPKEAKPPRGPAPIWARSVECCMNSKGRCHSMHAERERMTYFLYALTYFVLQSKQPAVHSVLDDWKKNWQIGYCSTSVMVSFEA
jgi:hypothetical protein